MRHASHTMRAGIAACGLATAAALIAAPLGAQAPDPIRVRGRRADVLVYAPSVRDSVADATRLAHLVSGCRVGMQVLPADSAEFVGRTSPAFPLDVWQVRDAVVLVVIPTSDRLVDCDDPRAQASLAPVRGLRVTLDTTYSRLHDVEEVVVMRGTRVLRPLLVERHPVRRLGADGFRTAGDHWLRLSFDRAELDPGPTGEITDLAVDVLASGGAAAERITLPWVAVRVAWESSLMMRPVLGATLAPPVGLPTPDDAQLRVVHEAYVAGEQERVVQLAATHFAIGAPASTLRREARTHAALALLALGDTASARVVTAALLRESPCVSFDAGAPASVRDLFAGPVRPAARCHAQAQWRTVVRAALLPGFARPADGARFDQRLLVFLASVGTSAAAVQLHAVARDRHDRYRAFQTVYVAPTEINNDVERLYRDAERARQRSVGVGAIGALIWIGQGFVALRNEGRLAEELRASTRLGGARALTLHPRLGPASVGLSLSLAW